MTTSLDDIKNLPNNPERLEKYLAGFELGDLVDVLSTGSAAERRAHRQSTQADAADELKRVLDDRLDMVLRQGLKGLSDDDIRGLLQPHLLLALQELVLLQGGPYWDGVSQSIQEVRDLRVPSAADWKAMLENPPATPPRGAGRTKPKRGPHFKWYRPPVLGFIGGAAAAALVGVLLYGGGLLQINPSSGQGEVLLAQATAHIDLRSRRGGGPEQIGGHILIRSPREGYATLLVLSPDEAVKIFPKPREAAIRVDPARSREYGPLLGPATILVIVTESSAADDLRHLVPAKPVAPDEVNDVLAQAEKVLWRAGHKWVAVARVVFEAKPAGDKGEPK